MIDHAPDKAFWLTVNDAARELGLIPETIRKEIRCGRMPGMIIARHVRIPRAEWEQFRAGTWTPKATPTVTPKPVDLIARRSA